MIPTTSLFNGPESRETRNAYKHLIRAMKSSEFAAENFHLGKPQIAFLICREGAVMISTPEASHTHCVRDIIFDQAIRYFSKCPAMDDIDKPGLFAQCARAGDVGCAEAIREMDDEE